MPVTKIGQWSNVEDEVLKAAISKYGLNQWARVSSLIAKKTAKQCKARWNEWLDPSIKKTEWSREDDEKLLTMARLMPTQWRSIAPIVGRTATQCLERYQKLLDEQEAKDSGDLGLAGPGSEAAAPTAEDVRKLRPGEVDAYAESRPARPDAVDMDEEDKEMLSEARARLANTNGKKAKRKARERQLEESRRLALLQKRRELKAAGINIKIVPKKTNTIDYNADVPLEKEVPAGFFDTTEELERNERQREAFDPRKQQLANKRKADQEEPEDRKRKKNDKGGASNLAAAAAKAAQAQKIREAEMQSKRRSLNLPAPQVGESELEDIVKMGMAGERAITGSGSDNFATQGLVGNYANIVGNTPIRTPRAPQQEDVVANEIKNARARTEMQSALFGGENADMLETPEVTRLQDIEASRQSIVTPNPMATPFRQGGAGGGGATPMRAGPGATPMRTPRDNFRLNEADGMQLVGQTPLDIKRRENAMRQDLKSRLAALPKPKETEWEFELPDEQAEVKDVDMTEEDAAERDRRKQKLREAAERAEFNRQSQVIQKFLPRPSMLDIEAQLKRASAFEDPMERAVETEMILLVANDMLKFGGGQVSGSSRPLEKFEDEALNRARMEIALEVSQEGGKKKDDFQAELDKEWAASEANSKLPGLDVYDSDEVDEQLMAKEFDNVQEKIMKTAEQGNKIEKKLGLHHKGYQQRAQTLRQKVADAAEALEKVKLELDSARTMQISEQSAVGRRLESLREEVSLVSRRERETQDQYRALKDELDGLQVPNGVH